MHSIMAILDDNNDISKFYLFIGDKIMYSKTFECFTIKNRYLFTTNDWRQKVLQNRLKKT